MVGGDSAPGSAISLLAGGGARLLAVTVVSPLELVRTKMQSQKLAWSELRSCLRGLLAAQVLCCPYYSRTVSGQGVRGLWNGYTATLLRDVPFSSLYWPLYERTKDQITRQAPAADRF